MATTLSPSRRVFVVSKMEFRLHYRCKKIIAKGNKKQILWLGPSKYKFAITEKDPMTILNSEPLLRSLTRQMFCHLKGLPIVQYLCNSDSNPQLAKCLAIYEDEHSWIAGYSTVDFDDPSNNKHPKIRRDKRGTFAQLFVSIIIKL